MKLLRVLSLILAAVMLLSACAAPTQAPAPVEEIAEAAQPEVADTAEASQAPETVEEVTPTHDGILRVGYTGKVKTLNPLYTSMAVESMHLRLVYEQLFQWDLNAQVQPLLSVDEGTMSEDGLTYVFKIHENSTWSDGEPLTAEDVAFSMNLYRTREDAKTFSGFIYIDSVEATGPYEVTFKLNEPRPNFRALMADNVFILPKHIWGPMAEDPNLADFSQLDAEIVGSGPWILKEIKIDEYAMFFPRPDHYMYPPKVNGLIYQTFANNDAAVQALIAGQVDLISRVPITALETVKAADNIEVISGMPSGPSVDELIINNITPDLCPADFQSTCGGHPALRDVAVRRAMAYATDQQKMIELVYGGMATPGTTLVPPSSAYYNPDVTTYPYDLAKANALLDEAGYVDTNGDDVRNMPGGGEELIFNLNFDTDPNYSRQAEILDESFKQIGIKLEIAPMESSALSPFVNPQYQHDLVIWGWSTGVDPDFMLSLTTTDMILNTSSEVGFSNAEYDQLYREQAVAATDELRKEKIFRMQEIFMDQLPYIVFFYKDTIFAHRTDKFEGWTFTDSKGLVTSLNTPALSNIYPVYK